MSKDNMNTESKKEVKEETTKKLTKEELKAKFREADLEYKGRLFIDPKYKHPDKVLRIDNADAGTRNYLESLGYRVVQESIPVGSGSLREPSNMGSAVHVEQAIYGESQPGILYEIDKDLYDARKEFEAERNNEQLQQTIEASQRTDQRDLTVKRDVRKSEMRF